MKRKLIATLFVLAASAISVLSAPGDVDPGYTPYAARIASLNSNTAILATEMLPDGKVLIAGTFNVVGGFARPNIARLNADGTVDPTFIPPLITSGTTVSIGAIGLLPNGKIMIAGNFLNVDGVLMRGIARLNADGSADTPYNTSLATKAYVLTGNVRDIEPLPDSGFLIGGDFVLGLTPSTSIHMSVYRIDPNGNFDPSFNTVDTIPMTVYKIRRLADGKVMIGGWSGSAFNNTGLARLHPDGYIDFSFSGVHGGIVYDIEPTLGGQYLIAGSFTSLNGFTQGRISRINNDGGIDLTFLGNNLGANGDIRTLDVLGDGRLLIGGAFTSFNSVSKNRLARLNSDASVDGTFNYDQVNDGTIMTTLIFSDGRVLVGGTSGAWTRIGIVNPAGTFQPASPFVGDPGMVRAFAGSSDGKNLIGGWFDIVNGVSRRQLARINADGTFDTTFNPPVMPSGDIVQRIRIQPDGKILIGLLGAQGVYRLLPNGAIDTGFNRGLGPSIGTVNDLDVLGNGQILIGGDLPLNNLDFRRLIRCQTNGDIDVTFNTPTINGTINRIVRQSDGKILIGGAFTQIGAVVRGRIARLNSDGSLDATFNPIGGANAQVNDVAVQPDGKILIAGDFTAVNGSNAQSQIARLNADGSLDGSFVQQVNSPILTLRLQSDGKIIIGGQFTVVGGFARSGIARLNPSGAVDTTFQIGTGANNRVWDVLVQADGKIVAGGEFWTFNGLPRGSIVRLLAANAFGQKFDFDGDGKADQSVFRPSTNRWYRRLSGNGSIVENDFGLAGDVIAPADFDGDGKTDIAIFRPGSGDWWYLSSATNTQNSVRWGAAGDVPRPADFDGDGKADFILYRPSDGVWYRLGSTGTVSIAQFGAAGDKPVVGDFDGDGKADQAIFRPSTGDWWYVESSSGSNRTEHWGLNGDTPVTGDYDGDGRTDLAVFRPSGGIWYIRNSSGGNPSIINFGISTDIPVAADYDGDGRCDLAVYRPSEGNWYLLQSQNGFAVSQLGAASDLPAPAAFVP